MPARSSSRVSTSWSAIPTATAKCWNCSITAWRSAFAANIACPAASGDRSLNAVRVAAARFLRDADAEGAPLSPNWKGVIASDEPQRFIVPIWVMALVRRLSPRQSISGSRWG